MCNTTGLTKSVMYDVSDEEWSDVGIPLGE
jgi:hypothetical protein